MAHNDFYYKNPLLLQEICETFSKRRTLLSCIH